MMMNFGSADSCDWELEFLARGAACHPKQLPLKSCTTAMSVIMLHVNFPPAVEVAFIQHGSRHLHCNATASLAMSSKSCPSQIQHLCP